MGCFAASFIGGIAELCSGLPPITRLFCCPVHYLFLNQETGRDNWAGVDDNFIIPFVVSFALLGVGSFTSLDSDKFTKL
jgi:hypothetical protein